MIRGSFDVVTTTEALGWAYGPGQTEPVLVQAVLNQEVLGEGLAGLHRPDLAAAGFGDGNAGFAIRFFRPIDSMYLPFISIKVEGGDAELPRSPVAGFKEFFAALHIARPAAGRHRSLNGGLWTDRTDAIALLQSKLRIGAVAQEFAAPLEHLIHHGFMLAAPNGTPDYAAWRRDVAAHGAKLLETPHVLPLLQAALEDSPMGVKADWFEFDGVQFAQPSAANPSPSAGECLELVLPFTEGVSLDVIRNSHVLPEFTVNGHSRWTEPGTGTAAAGNAALLDQIMLAPGSLALVGPGTLYRIQCAPGAAALRLQVLPVRGRILGLPDEDDVRQEHRKSGVLMAL